MATVTFRLANYVRKDGKQQVQMWVYAGDSEKPVDTGIKISGKQWDKKRSRVRPAHPNAAVFNATLDKMEQAAEKSFAQIKGKGHSITAAKIAADAFTVTDFHRYLEDHINAMNGPTQFSAKSSFKTLQKMLLEFRPTLHLEDIDTDFLNAFEAFLRARPGTTGKGLLDSTINKRMAQLEAVYSSHKKRAHPSPFEDYQMPSSENLKEYEPLEESDIEAIWNAEARTRTQSEAKDLFLFCYYAAGMRPGDALSLEWSEVGTDAIVYLENKKEHLKKQRKVHVLITPRLRTLLERRPKTGKTIFGILEGIEDGDALRNEIKRALATRRQELQILALRAGVTKWVSFKITRHTFARKAEKKTSLDQARHALNHSTTRMTGRYAGHNVDTALEVQRAVYEEPEKQPDTTAIPEPKLQIRRYNSGGG